MLRFFIGVTVLRALGFETLAFIVAPIRKSPQNMGGVLVLVKHDSDLFSGSFQGAGSPRPDLTPEEIPSLLMKSLELNDFPHVDAGLESMWAFAGDTTRHIFQQNMTDFIESAHKTADELPTSFYAAAMYGKEWSMETSLNFCGKDKRIATQVMKTICSDGRLRRWQWELRENRRPPDMGCWFIESIGSSNRKGHFEAE